MLGEGKWRSNPMLTLAYSYWKASKGIPGLTSLSDSWFTVECTYAFTNGVQADLGLIQVYFGN